MLAAIRHHQYLQGLPQVSTSVPEASRQTKLSFRLVRPDHVRGPRLDVTREHWSSHVLSLGVWTFLVVLAIYRRTYSPTVVVVISLTAA
jgi:hypothetical protein